MLTANGDGTITFLGRKMGGMQVAELVTGLLGAISEATKQAGQLDEAKSKVAAGAFHAIRPDMLQLRHVQGQSDPVLTLIFGHAHIGVELPQTTLRDLSRGILTDLPPDPKVN